MKHNLKPVFFIYDPQVQDVVLEESDIHADYVFTHPSDVIADYAWEVWNNLSDLEKSQQIIQDQMFSDYWITQVVEKYQEQTYNQVRDSVWWHENIHELELRLNPEFI